MTPLGTSSTVTVGLFLSSIVVPYTFGIYVVGYDVVPQKPLDLDWLDSADLLRLPRFFPRKTILRLSHLFHPFIQFFLSCCSASKKIH